MARAPEDGVDLNWEETLEQLGDWEGIEVEVMVQADGSIVLAMQGRVGPKGPWPSELIGEEGVSYPLDGGEGRNYLVLERKAFERGSWVNVESRAFQIVTNRLSVLIQPTLD